MLDATLVPEKKTVRGRFDYMDIFSIEELNLMVIYDTSNRESLMNGLITGLKSVFDPEMLEIFTSTIRKLATLTDDEFSDIGFYAADDVAWEVFDVDE